MSSAPSSRTRRSRLGARVAAAVVVAGSLLGVAGIAEAGYRSGNAAWNGCAFQWGNWGYGSNGGDAATIPTSGCARTRTQMYYRTAAGPYQWSTKGWSAGQSWEKISGLTTITSRHSADTDGSGSFGYVDRGVDNP